MLRFDLQTERLSAPVKASGNVRPGTVLCLIGPTGAGKTTLLHMLSGRESASGALTLDLPDRAGGPDDLLRRSPHERRLAYVPQSPLALWPGHTVRQGVHLAERRRGSRRSDSSPFPTPPPPHAQTALPSARPSLVTDLLAAFRLAPLAQRRTSHLSGGELQRLVLCQALASGPRGLLLDEPLSQQDPAERPDLADLLKAWIRSLRIPAVWATHHVAEAQRAADEIAILEQGTIRWRGSPETLLESPPTVGLARLVGYTAFLPTESGEVVAVHPDRAMLGADPPDASGRWIRVSGTARTIRPWGGRFELSVQPDHGPLFDVALPAHARTPAEGERVTVYLSDTPRYTKDTLTETEGMT